VGRRSTTIGYEAKASSNEKTNAVGGPGGAGDSATRYGYGGSVIGMIGTFFTLRRSSRKRIKTERYCELQL
jgi:hypothetical protein